MYMRLCIRSWLIVAFVLGLYLFQMFFQLWIDFNEEFIKLYYFNYCRFLCFYLCFLTNIECKSLDNDDLNSTFAP
jgi:hypothetical protein